MDLKDTKCFKNFEQGSKLWRMHNNCQICCLLWNDKKLVLLISTHALQIQAPCEFPMITIFKWQGAIRNGIPTSPVFFGVYHKYRKDECGGPTLCLLLVPSTKLQMVIPCFISP